MIKVENKINFENYIKNYSYNLIVIKINLGKNTFYKACELQI